MSSNEVTIEKATPNQIPAIISFLWDHFIPDENVLQSYIRQSPHKFTEEVQIASLSNFSKAMEVILNNHMCLVAVHFSSKEIIGAVVLESQQKTLELSRENKSPEWTSILQEVISLKNTISQLAEIPFKFRGVRKVIMFTFLTVHRMYRKKNLSILLLTSGIQWAREENFHLVAGVFTSTYSKKAAERAGMEGISQCNLLNFRDRNGSHIFKVEPPDNIVNVMAINLRSSNPS